MTVYTGNLRTCEAKAGGQGIPGHLGLHCETLSEAKKLFLLPIENPPKMITKSLPNQKFKNVYLSVYWMNHTICPGWFQSLGLKPQAHAP